MNEYFELNALIADDSPVMLSSIRRILFGMGFKDSNVVHVKDPKAVLYQAKKEAFDVVICDFNFMNRLNGRQIFEELNHYGLLKDTSVFMMVTGESSAKVVRAIIELMPDEYLLKPFNATYLNKKLSRAINRRKALGKLYGAHNNKEYEKGLTLCDELEFDHHKYYSLIQKFRGEFLRHLNRYREAKELYEGLLEDNDTEWANVGLVDSYIEMGDVIKAQSLINEYLEKVPSSVSMLNMSAKSDIYSSDIPSAVKKFEYLSEISPGNPDRELVIANLCFSQGDYNTAATRYMVYFDLSKDTYRNTVESRYNVIRTLLCYYNSLGNKEPATLGNTTSPGRKVKPEIYFEYHQISQSHQADVEYGDDGGTHISSFMSKELVEAHIHEIEGNIKHSILMLKHAFKVTKWDNFYELFHFAYLLSLFMYDKEFNAVISKTEFFINNKEIDPLVLNSMIAMISKLKEKHVKQKNYIKKTMGNYESMIQQGNVSLAIDELIKLTIKAPYFRDGNSLLIKNMVSAWPTNYTRGRTKKVLEACYERCKGLYTTEEMLEHGISTQYENALQGLER
ncbi:response regulator [Vibrio mediterranei]|uniref:response regulator n=1 Tax=Vibrio mediterranei TaxID=689 RepID=UPI000D18158A|nr:response regulator [Vibrio mediterranei]PTC04305.1 response regulator [Vibrio mediterranei]